MKESQRDRKSTVTIIGGGPIGCHTAELLAERGHDVTVLEEHPEIGRPVQCTGIVTPRIVDLVNVPKKAIVNRLKSVQVVGPSTSTKIPNNDIIIDRTLFDQGLWAKASHKGANIILGAKAAALSRKGKTHKIRVTDGKKVSYMTTHSLIGADGPNSIVSKYIGNQRPKCWLGMQAVCSGRFNSDEQTVHLGSKYPGFFAWVVPESTVCARIGVASAGNPRKAFDTFMRTCRQRYRCKPISIQGGLIPRYDPRLRIERDDAYLVGDAATQVKATTGGGLVPGLEAAKALARAVHNRTNYNLEVRRTKISLRASLMIRKMLDRFDDSEYDNLIRLVSQDKMKRLLAAHDRDRPISLGIRTLIKEPRFALFARRLL